MLNLANLVLDWLENSPQKDFWILGDKDQHLSMLQLNVLESVDLKDIPHYVMNSVEGTIKQCCAPPNESVNLNATDPNFFEKLERSMSTLRARYEFPGSY